MYINRKTKKQLLDIAKEKSYSIQVRGDLEYRFNDSEDFVEVSVGAIKEIMKAAYELGFEAGRIKE